MNGQKETLMSLTINGVELPQSARAVAPERVVPPLSPRSKPAEVLYWVRLVRLGENLYELALTPDGQAIFIKDTEEAFAVCKTIEQNNRLPAGWQTVYPKVMGLLPDEPSSASRPEAPGWAAGGA